MHSAHRTAFPIPGGFPVGIYEASGRGEAGRGVARQGEVSRRGGARQG